MIASLPLRVVVILLDYRPALSGRTGVGEYVHELARALTAPGAPAGESLRLFSSSWADRLAPDAVPGAGTVDRRIPVRVLNLLWHRLGWPPVERLAGPIDVAHSSHPLLMPARRAAQVVTVYDLDFLDHPERTRAEIRRDYPALAARHARRADHVVVISRHTRDGVVARLGVPADRVTVAHPGAPAWPRREREPDAGYVLFLGTLEPRKNLGALLDAWERVLAARPDAPPLVLAGRETPAAAPLLDRLSRAPLRGRVERRGYVDDATRPALYAGALALALPSHTEGWGLTAVEAMTCGVPVVAADRGALPEAVGEAGLLVDPDDPAAFAAALGRVLADAALRQRLREAGWRQAARFRWADTAARVREAWARAVEHRSRRG